MVRQFFTVKSTDMFYSVAVDTFNADIIQGGLDKGKGFMFKGKGVDVLVAKTNHSLQSEG